MRSFIIIPLFVMGALAACEVKNDDEGNAGAGGASAGQGGSGPGAGAAGAPAGGGAGRGSGTQGAGGGLPPGPPGWTVVSLVDDKSSPQKTIYHAGNDMVTGIFFNSLDDGFVTTTGQGETSSDGGAVFRAKQKEVTEVLFGGDDGTALCLSVGTIDYLGIEKTPDGYVARAHACDLVASADGSATFGIGPVGAGNPFGIERILAYRKTATGATLVRDSGVVSVTAQTPGPEASWDDVWAPKGVPPTPNPVPDDQCQKGPQAQILPKISQTIYVSPDARFMAYTASPDYNPQICVSTDGGRSFYPKLLPGVAEEVLFSQPAGVMFLTPTTGVTWYANNIYPGSSYIYRTTDGGDTWAKVALPETVAAKKIDLTGGFFAPDGAHGWLVGYDYEGSAALLLKTSDAGATWTAASGDLAAKVSAAGGGKLRSGFALDANHLWVGGDKGVLVANEAGGE